MKKNLIVSIFVVILVLSIIATPLITFALTEAEIDAYYDAQKLKNKENYDKKVQAIKDQLEVDLDNLDKERQEGIWEIYKNSFGENFELVKPFLPESKPDPNLLTQNLLLNLPRENALYAISVMNAVNPELANKVKPIYESEYSKLKPTISAPTVEKVVPKIQKKEEVKKVIDITKDVSVVSTSGTESKEITKIGVEKKDVIKQEPVKKIKWYKKVLNWLF
jgi:hypothetical protein